MLVSPLNDKKCLHLLLEEVKRLAQKRKVRDWVKQFRSIDEVIAYIRSLEQCDDLGNLADGTRLPCEISQRARFASMDPNCLRECSCFSLQPKSWTQKQRALRPAWS